MKNTIFAFILACALTPTQAKPQLPLWQLALCPAYPNPFHKAVAAICFFHPFPHDGAMERASYYLVSSEMYKITHMVMYVSVQSALLKEYPNKMLVTVTQCVFSTVQSFVVAVVAERDFSKWKLRFDISLLAIIYTVINITIF
jgi:hypothetical protein